MKKFFYILPILAIALFANSARATDYPVMATTTNFVADTGGGGCSYSTFGSCNMSPYPLAFFVNYNFQITKIMVDETTTPHAGNNNSGNGSFKAYIFNSIDGAENHIVAESENISAEWSDAQYTYQHPTTFTFAEGITLEEGFYYFLGFESNGTNLQSGALMTISSSTIYGSIGLFEFQQPTSTVPRADFSNWLIGSYLSGTNPYPYSEFCVEYGQSTTTMPFRDCQYHGPLPETAGGQTAILKTRELEFGTWYAKAVAYAIDDDSNKIKLIETEFMEFEINKALSPDALYFEYLKNQTRITLQDCSAHSGPFFSSSTINGLVCGVQNTWANLVNFVLDTVDRITTSLGKLFQATFPINIFAHINRDFTTAKNATSTANIILNENSNPDIFGGRTFTILSTGTMATAQANVNFDYRTVLNYIVYALTGCVMLYFSVLTVGHLRKDKRNQV